MWAGKLIGFPVEEGKIKLIIFGLTWCGRQGYSLKWDLCLGGNARGQQNLGVDKNFVKRTNQWEFVTLWLMLQNEAKKKENLQYT